MNKLILLFLFSTLCVTSFSQIDNSKKIKARKLTYNDFTEISVNDTSIAVIDLFFSKKENALYDQMSLLPLSLILFVFPPSKLIGAGTAIISVPLFLNGSYMLVKYRKKKLYNILIEYQKTQTLPKWVRKRTNKLLIRYDDLEIDY